MKQKAVNIFWGFILILISGLLLVRTLGYIDFEVLSEQFWILAFGVASAAFFLSYFLNGVHKWGWLFPAFISAALALTIALATHGDAGSYVGAPILIAIALPFLVGFALERKSWGLLIPAFVLLVLAAVTLMADSVRGEYIGALVQFAIGLPFLVVYLRDHQKRWALIPGLIMCFLGLITLVSAFAAGEWIGALVMYAAALSFLAVYLFNRTRRWALLPAGILVVIGTIPMLAAFTREDVTGAAVMFLFALPFLVVYFWSKNNWWALIPAGIFTSIGLVVVLSLLFPNGQAFDGLFGGVLFLGFALTFGLLWLRRKSQPTGWAGYPALGLLAASLLAFLLGERFQDFWPAAVLLVIGVLLLFPALFRRKPPVDPTPPTVNPPVDPTPPTINP
jgi:hypothetical protein